MRALADGAFHAIPGKSYATPKELWGFRSEGGTGTPRTIAWAFLDANGNLHGGRHATTFRRRGIGPVE